MISVITVTKNDTTRLTSTIKSLENYYKLKNFQHIVVHGGVINDSEKKLIKSHKKIELVYENDSGIYDAMNKGINRCLMEYVLFLNCGDRLLMPPRILKIVLNKSKKNNIICLPYIQEWSSGSIKKTPTSPKKNILPTSHQAMLFKNEFIKRNLYDTTYKIAADFDLYLKSDFSNIQIVKNCNPLTIVEGDGVASINSYIAYNEYIKIVFHKYGLIKGFTSITKILVKSLLVRSAKKLISKNAMVKIRSIFNTKN
jgi:putative colanic acid biosynthesis glycosyltransferase